MISSGIVARIHQPRLILAIPGFRPDRNVMEDNHQETLKSTGSQIALCIGLLLPTATGCSEGAPTAFPLQTLHGGWECVQVTNHHLTGMNLFVGDEVHFETANLKYSGAPETIKIPATWINSKTRNMPLETEESMFWFDGKHFYHGAIGSSIRYTVTLSETGNEMTLKSQFGMILRLRKKEPDQDEK